MREKLAILLEGYDKHFQGESQRVEMFKSRLQEKDFFLRTSHSGHFTSSAFVTNKSKDKILLMKHKKLNKWLQPGGHADGDENLMKVAIKELEEETGAKGKIISSVKGMKNVPLDISIHSIPEYKETSSHLHYDWRFLVEADDSIEIIENDESDSIKWFTLNEAKELVADNSGLIRMIKKLEEMK